MGKCNGYRPKKENAEKVQELRQLLSTTHRSQWQKANHIIQEITELCGHMGGPSNGMITARSCKYCRFYGHTYQYCQMRLRDEEAESERILLADKMDREEREKERMKQKKREGKTQDEWFDEMGIPYYRDPKIGPILTNTGGDGKWVYCEDSGRIRLSDLASDAAGSPVV